jgi:hypothetical protein
MIREIKPSDLPRLRALGLEHDLGTDLIEGLVSVDQDDQPVMFAGAWLRAEVHMALDHSYSTPGARFVLLQEIHAEMERRLKRRKIGQVVTWLENNFGRRLRQLGWAKSELTSWHRKVY